MKNLGMRRMMKRSVKCSMRSIHSKLPKNQIPCHVELTAGQKLVEDLDVEKDSEKDSKNEDTNPFQTQIPVKSDVEGTNKMAVETEVQEGHPFQFLAIKTRAEVLEMWLAKKDGKSLKAEGFASNGAENGKGNDPTGTLSSAVSELSIQDVEET